MKKEVKKLMKQNDMILIRHKNHCIWQHNTLKFKVATDTAKMNVGKAAAQARKRKKKDKR